MHPLHSVQGMQASQPVHRLLTALEVQDLLHIDRSTVYRMAEDGRLPAIRVGRSWRFPEDRIASILSESDSVGVDPLPSPRRSIPPASSTESFSGATPDAAVSHAAASVAADLLGVMMVVTDMAGRPLTEVVNPCGWFARHGAEPDVTASCIAEWRDLAEQPDLIPRFETGVHGFQCARAFIRGGHQLVGMVLAGGVSPPSHPEADPQLFHLDDRGRARVLDALPHVAAAISTASTLKKELS
jgi:excisionase family DNA binding protein